MINRVLVCTDGSQYANACNAYAAWIAKHTQATIDVLYVSDIRQFEVSLVADLSGSMGMQPYQDMLSQIEEIEQQKAELLKEHLLGFFRDEGLADRVSFHHTTGLIVDELEAYETGDQAVDMVILGKRGENANFATEHLGSNLERIVRASSKPCLVVSRRFAEITTVLLAFDGSPSTLKAVDFLQHSSIFKNAYIHVLTACKNGTEEAQEQMQTAASSLEASGYKVTAHLVSGDPEDEVIALVQKFNVDLLIMGAYGHSKIRRLLIGSTTTDLLRSCKIPLLLFR